jgi:hypothetical protein
MVVITNGGVRIADGDPIAMDELKNDRETGPPSPATVTP